MSLKLVTINNKNYYIWVKDLLIKIFLQLREQVVVDFDKYFSIHEHT